MGAPTAIEHWTRVQEVNPFTKDEGLKFAPTGESTDLVTVAWLGRTSTYDQQDPTLSLPRQLKNCQAALPSNAVIVAFFYDIESGRKDLDQRGASRAHEAFDLDIPRDGSVSDLMVEATSGQRRFTHVICESIDRVARRAYFGSEIEHRLEKVGVKLLAADEPINLTNSRREKRATNILTRRVKQGVSEWYVLDMLEKSWDGFEVHTEAGFNVGKPCYGFRADLVPHPVPARRERGEKKTRLIVHAVEGAVVKRIFTWRIEERLSYQAIADRLNEDLVLNPPPTPVNPARAVGRWTVSSVREVLINPKYTGHMVWNRKARKGGGRNRPNPPSQWIWSPAPVHEAIVSVEDFVLAQQVSDYRRTSRCKPYQGKHDNSDYRIRSFITCDPCDRRMCSNRQHGHIYYACNPKKQYRPEGHPAICRVRESALLTHLSQFFSTHVFGDNRHDLLNHSDEAAEADAKTLREEQVRTLEHALSDNETRAQRLVRSLEIAEELDATLLKDIGNRRRELLAEREDLKQRLAKAQEQHEQTPNRELLNLMPTGTIDLAEVPEPLTRQLFEAFRLEIRYDYRTKTATCRITLTSTTMDFATRAAAQAGINGAPASVQAKGTRDGLCGAQDETRTRTP